MRAIRGATTVETNRAAEIYAATKEVFETILQENNLSDPENLVSVIITVTEDLTAAFPARAIREMDGFELVPVMGMQEINVPGAPEKCIRLMVQTNLESALKDIRHVYLNGAKRLRPDLAVKGEDTP
ncbi:chorismate mutase [Listeria floridensis FSL S10-1187]|uniref:chorismate mutase n=1 Tax=Listeria floridensis FSL S10-1187 TaxID=1265817 RepID=A0ABN0RGB2_9LIST|nr:chorismate mutase [Listeria floridensis]EUJ32930.1 chorismate mutase [Listeria floridensis FSL S10-1187]